MCTHFSYTLITNIIIEKSVITRSLRFLFHDCGRQAPWFRWFGMWENSQGLTNTFNGDPVGTSRTVTKTIDQKENPTPIMVVGNEERLVAWDAP